MICVRLTLEGQQVIVCRGRQKIQFCACGRESHFLCDWKVTGNKSGTCDAPICVGHAKEVAPGKHLCPLHQKKYDEWKRRHPDRVLAAEMGQQPSLFEVANG